VIETRRTEVEVHWRPSPLTRAVVTCAAAALAVAVIGGFWQLIAFAAPLVGVLMSIGWQRGVPKVHVYGEPGSLRCFESEETRLSVWAVAETAEVTVALTVEAVDVCGSKPSSRIHSSAGRWPPPPTSGAATRSWRA